MCGHLLPTHGVTSSWSPAGKSSEGQWSARCFNVTSVLSRVMIENWGDWSQVVLGGKSLQSGVRFGPHVAQRSQKLIMFVFLSCLWKPTFIESISCSGFIYFCSFLNFLMLSCFKKKGVKYYFHSFHSSPRACVTWIHRTNTSVLPCTWLIICLYLNS